MKKNIVLLALLLFTGCSSVDFTYNGLRCPTNDMNEIRNDLKTCRVYNVDDVDKALGIDQECQSCLENKGYQIQNINTQENNASQ